MKHDDILTVLPDYHEGMLAADQVQAVEQHLAQCRDCSAVSAAVAFGFSELRKEPAMEAPAHYFTNLIPRIHARIEIPKRRAGRVWLPSWTQPLLAPFSAAGVVLSVAALYILLGSLPAADGSLQGLVAQVPQDELVRLADLETPFSESLAHQPILETVPNASLVAGRLGHQLLADDSIYDSFAVTSISDESVIESLSDDEAASIINHMSQTAIL